MFPDPLQALETHFGFREFRDGQEEIVTALVSGRDALVVMPTGGGKSLCFQLPALMRDGVTLVVSPLIALMKDQVDALERRGIPAGLINSSQTLPEQNATFDRLFQRDFDLHRMSVEGHDGIQSAGKRLIIVAQEEARKCLYFRVFDDFGKRILDKSEEELCDHYADVQRIKNLLNPLWDAPNLPSEQHALTFQALRSITGHTLRSDLKLLYLAPERFRAEGFRNKLKKVTIALFAVDEAHCLSQWGHDFRPDYLRLGQALEELGRPQVAAFTATATPAVRRDILETLKLRDPFVSITGFERPNLSLRVRRIEKRREKFDLLSDVIQQWKTGIVYCSTRKNVEEVADYLSGKRLRVIAYHGGMTDELRKQAQEQFISRRADVVVATNAFGMGIDRPDVRFVVHYDVPGSIEAYYQEAGRAGRDGEQAVCELLFNYPDTETQRFFLDGNNPDSRQIRNVYSSLLCRSDDQQTVVASIADIADWANEGNSMVVSSALSVLARTGYIHRFDVPGQRVRGTRITQPEVSGFDLQLDEAALAAKKKSDEEKLAAMVRFCYDDRCRQQWILRYFGEAAPDTCGNCDVCLTDSPAERRPPSPEEMLLVRKTLSGVARMSHRHASGYQARFGRGKIIAMLTGSQAEELRERGLDRLPTFGALRGWEVTYLTQLFKELEKAGLLKTEMGDYPLVTLTDRGASVMKEEAPFTLSWPATHAKAKRSSSSRGSKPEPGGAPDAELLDKLKKKRAELAQAEGKPPFLIFSNQTLENFARAKPTSKVEALDINGVGEVKSKRYLTPFLEVIRNHQGASA